MDEIIMFAALGMCVEDVTGKKAEEILPAEVIAKIDAYVDGTDTPTLVENEARLITLFERATDALLAKIDAEAGDAA